MKKKKKDTQNENRGKALIKVKANQHYQVSVTISLQDSSGKGGFAPSAEVRSSRAAVGGVIYFHPGSSRCCTELLFEVPQIDLSCSKAMDCPIKSGQGSRPGTGREPITVIRVINDSYYTFPPSIPFSPLGVAAASPLGGKEDVWGAEP